jgi:hypothetical protein
MVERPGAGKRILSFVWGVAVLVGAVIAAYFLLIGVLLTLADNPCSLGDEPCEGTPALRVIGAVFTLLAGGAVISGLGAAVSYGIYAISPDGSAGRRANRLFLAAVTCAGAVVLLVLLVSFAADAGLHLKTYTRP